LLAERVYVCDYVELWKSDCCYDERLCCWL